MIDVDEESVAPCLDPGKRRNLLRAERSWRVVKSGEWPDQPFERKKIVEAVRAACRDAKRDDILIPRLVLPRVIEELRAGWAATGKSRNP